MRCVSVCTSIVVIVLLLAGVPTHVHAIATANLAISEAPPANTPSVYNTFNWNYVYNYKGASASAVDHYWILTAAHVADDGGTGNLLIGGETYYQQEVVLHTQAADPDGNVTADIALVRYDKPLPGYYLLADAVPVGSEVIICGFGYSGNVVSTSTQAYFTQDGTTHTNKRWGTNIIDLEKTGSSTVPIVATTKGFDITISKNKQNAAKTVYEAGCNVFDSGGGMFYNDSGTWKHVGHMVGRYGGGPFTGNFASATTYYVKWIKSVIVDYDTDMDGLPDWWETLHGETEAGADPDVDGFTNYEEWIADTLPKDSNSSLRVTAYTNSTSLVFSSSDNRKYQVQYRTDLTETNASWQTEADWFEGDPVQTVQSVSNLSSNRFYRVRVKLR